VRRAYFGQASGWREAQVVNRSALKTVHQGPCIVEEYDATCLVPPGWSARLDAYGNMALAPQS
jgi:N-methylhydantoinase A